MEEQELIEKLKQGQIHAYEFLFNHHYDWLCNYIFQLSGDRDLSKDLVQDVMIKLWEKRKQINIKGSLKGYLFKACHNQFLQQLRKQKKQPDLLDKIRWDTIYESYFEQKEDDTYLKSTMAKLEELIDKLPPKCKEIFIMNKLERRKYREIAEDMGISIKTVENQMSKALRIIRENASVLMF
ncbi:RNA polymerase sigma-70 factor [uncultured Allomuricauda sp.]|uniref:RNA polymerase sigma factor n=1 Tax=Flagellimonas sp. W118 TaxID=3410791 RepID=UPI0026205382|nr:RNA polymerase sigma-70 factor [uncultured Allomuricauda sp.]